MTTGNRPPARRRRPTPHPDTTTTTFTAGAEEITVDVVVSHGQARRGDRGEVPATDRVKGLIARGYLRPVTAAHTPRPTLEHQPEQDHHTTTPPEPS